MLRREDDEKYLTTAEKIKFFMSVHWRGVVIVITPIILIGVLQPLPGAKHQWAAYTLLLIAVYWVTECIPIPVTSFIPLIIFPLTDVLDTRTCARVYMNDSIMMFLGSLMMAYSVEQSGLHKRLAYFSIRVIGYSHVKLLLAMCCVTTFVSMWLSNTAATTMMIPIIFAFLNVFEDQNIMHVYDTTPEGELVASDITASYFCCAAYSASIGGIGTLVGTGTNLVFKGLFISAYPDAPEYLSFPKFSAFGVPLMILLETSVFFSLAILHFGFLRPGSKAAKAAEMPESAKIAAKAAIDADVKRRGKISYWEINVCILFGSAMIAFFCRSPQIFTGWGDRINERYGITDNKYIRDSALAMLVAFLMLLLPRSPDFFKNCTAKYYEDLPKTRSFSVLSWKILNDQLPYAFCFLLGGGFSLSTAANASGLNTIVGEQMKVLGSCPNYVIILLIVLVVIIVTNVASNVAVCNVFTPICMQLAKEINQNPLWYCIASGYTASFCFMLPVGTPPNLIVQGAANIPTNKVILAGSGPTFCTIIVTWLLMYFWGPVIWPDLNTLPEWASKTP